MPANQQPLQPPVLDRSGAPMVWVAALEGHIHLLPVTKINFESFLCDPECNPEGDPDDPTRPKLDQAWYEQVLKLGKSGREALTNLRRENYWRAVMTGVQPREAQAYADWNGRLHNGFFELPTQAQWLTAYRELQQRPALPADELRRLPLSPRFRLLLDRLQRILDQVVPAATGRTLADQMMMRGGVMEWVRLEHLQLASWGGFGEPPQLLHASLLATLRSGNPQAMPRAEDERYEHYGFRLIRRDV